LHPFNEYGKYINLIFIFSVRKYIGYKYYFLLGFVELPNKHGASDTNDIDKEFQDLITEILSEYDQLKKIDWFPIIGEPDSTGSAGYGLGSTSQLLPSFMKLTRKFPEITFRLCHVYNDYSRMTLYIIKDKRLISTTFDGYDESSSNDESYDSYPNFGFLSTTIPNNITNFFNSKYPFKFNLETTI
jgi:hypothetical protein